MDLNNVSMTGRLTKDCLAKTTTNSNLVEFDIAVNGLKPEDTFFIQCTVWGKQASALEPYLQKGTRVAVTGALKESKWMNKEGEQVKKWSINVSQVALIGDKKSETMDKTPKRKSYAEEEDDGGEICF